MHRGGDGISITHPALVVKLVSHCLPLTPSLPAGSEHMSGDDWRDDDESRISRALAEMSERVEELERRCSMLEDEVGLQLFEDTGLGGYDDDEDDNLAGIEDEDIESFEEEAEFLGDIDDDEEDQRVADALAAVGNERLHNHEDVVKELGGGR